MKTIFAALPSRNRWFLVWTLFVLVLLAPLIIGLFCCERLIGDWLDQSRDYLFVPMFWSAFLWFMPPGMLFGEPIFRIGAMGTYPRGVIGWLLTPIFYAAVSFGLWALTLLFPRRHSKQ
jgi:hypothetical protein